MMRFTPVWLTVILLLVFAINAPAQPAGTNIFVIKDIAVDGKDLGLPGALQLRPWPGEVDIDVDANRAALSRPYILYYKLEGYDQDWRIYYSHMRMVIRMLDAENHIIAGTDCRVDGQSDGWRGSLQNSDFISHQTEVIAPMRAAKVQLWCVSGGPEYTTGIIGMRNISIQVDEAGGKSVHREFSTENGSDLDQPLGSPVDWQRDGSRPQMAQIIHLEKPQPGHALVLADDDPDTYAAWIVPPPRCEPVQPGDRVTLKWEEAHTVGCGLGILIYKRVPPGNYWLRVKALGIDNAPVGPETSLPFTVLSPIWIKPWFLFVCGSVAMTCATWGVRRHQKKSWQRRLDRLEQQGALERERTRIARDFHDDLGSRLTHIKMLSESACRHANNPPDTVADLSRISTAAREFTRSMEEIVWAVDPKNDSLDELATYLSGFAQDLLHSVKVRCRLDMPVQLPDWRLSAEIRHNIFMVLKEAVNNALKHGQPTEVQIKMTCEASRFKVTVEDNGRGFTGPRDSGYGLNNMRSRLQKCGGEFLLESEPGKGTRVSFIVPVKQMDRVN